ncbi:hypothetical protein [Flagellimonas sp.]|uniref:hypothetical protein n=1 Tax=Flagellimonas sp. TaxID=2058762 RepID=UPI003B52BDB7
MKTSSLKFALAAIILLSVINTTYSQESPKDKEPKEDREEHSDGDGITDTKDHPYQPSMLMYEDELAQTVDANDVYFTSLKSAYEYVEKAPQSDLFSPTKEQKCKTAWKLYKNTKCSVPKIKFAKQLVKAIGSGHISATEGALTTPGIEVIKNEITRLNVLIQIEHSRTLDYCNRMETICKEAKFVLYCNALEGRTTPDVIENTYVECTSLLKDDTSGFLTVLKEIGALVDKFQDGGISGDAAKNQISAKLDEISPED